MVGRRLLPIHVQAGCPHLAGVERLQQGILVHIAAPGGVDEHHAVLHLCQRFCPDDGLPVGGRCVHRDKIRLLQQFLHGYILHTQLFFQAGHRKQIVSQHFHAQRLTERTHRLSDPAEADDAKGLAVQLYAVGIGLFLPFILPHGMSGSRNEAAAGQQVGQRQFRHRFGGGAGRITDSNAVFLGIFGVNIVNAHAAPKNQLQPGALGLIDMTRSNLCGRSNHQCIILCNGSAQFLTAIMLLGDLEALLLQLFDGILVHAVSDQNADHCFHPFK